ncbi:MAG: hypothetical protein ABR990_13590, partial [Terracidiphilus sp.]
MVVTLHPWRTTQMPELAKVVPLRDEAVSPPLPQQQASAGAAHGIEPPRTTKPVAGNGIFHANHTPIGNIAPAPPATPSVDFSEIAPSAGVGQAFAPSSTASAPRQVTSAQYQPEPAVAAWQQEQQRTTGAYAASANTSPVSQKSMRMETYSANTSHPAAGGSAGPRMAQQSQSAPS